MRRFYRPSVPGGTVHIAPGVAHRIENTGSTVLRFPCCCSPAYRHEDTEFLESK